jgi:hypothetical protein
MLDELTPKAVGSDVEAAGAVEVGGLKDGTVVVTFVAGSPEVVWVVAVVPVGATAVVFTVLPVTPLATVETPGSDGLCALTARLLMVCWAPTTAPNLLLSPDASKTWIDANLASAAFSICCNKESSKTFGSETVIPLALWFR